jgi:hypothetical protein
MIEVDRGLLDSLLRDIAALAGEAATSLRTAN